ncbi:MAG: hypothetical protein JRJ87_20695 [Deltaproteobacteria bacterium]|nr:hypothetical protein [Deltaproteobacteria bacterium]
MSILGTRTSTWLKTVLLAVGLMASAPGCAYDPGVSALGYLSCSEVIDCPGGFVCIENICAPDCQGLRELVWVEPGTEDLGLWSCSKNADCEQKGPEDDDWPARVQVSLSLGDFVELGPDPGVGYAVGECERFVLRFSVLPLGASIGRKISVIILGEQQGVPVVGVDQEISLADVEAQGDFDSVKNAFRRHTAFFVVSIKTFGWPLRVRLFPVMEASAPEVVTVAVRDYKMYCCED